MSPWCPGQASSGARRPKIAVKALYGEAFRAPYINELHIDHPGLLGNPNLKSEHVVVDRSRGQLHRRRARIELVAKYFDNRQRDNIIEVLRRERRGRTTKMRAWRISEASSSAESATFQSSIYLTGSLLYQGSDDGHRNSRTSPMVPTSAPRPVSATARTPAPSVCSMFTRATWRLGCTRRSTNSRGPIICSRCTARSA